MDENRTAKPQAPKENLAGLYLPSERITEETVSRSWRIYLLVIWFSQLLAMLGFYACTPFLPYFIRELGITEERQITLWSSVLVAAPSMLLAIFSPVWGWLSDLHGRKPTVWRTMLGGAVTVFLIGRCVSVRQLLALRLVQGAITGTIPACIALVASTVPKAHLPSALGFLQMSVFAGTSFGPIVGGIAADRWGFRRSFTLASAALLTGALLVMFFVREEFERPTSAQKGSGMISNLRDLLSNRSLFLMSLVVFAAQFSTNAQIPVLPQLVEKIEGVGLGSVSTTAGGLMAATGISAAVSSALMGPLGNGRRTLTLLVAMVILSALVHMLHAAVHDLTHLYALRVLAGIAAGGMFPLSNSLLAKCTAPDARGTVYGVSSAASYLGNFAGPLVAGIVGFTFGLRSVFIAIGLLFLLVALALLQLKHADIPYQTIASKSRL
ncbi:MAG TPA: multidrug efflux MFS transporter [Clostridia bacterium]|nr:multidrug efflux MFS transporter [Clostridia bacterium]